MAHGYGGFYAATVMDNNDPLGQNRLHVIVPDIFADTPVWALASITDDSALPAVGDSVWVSFEAGNSDHPVWQRPEGTAVQAEHLKYVGKYHGRVIDNIDPLQERRVRVLIPDLGDDSMWASPGSEVEHLEPPELDTAVWIEFEYGDPQYPRWVGLI